MAKGMPFSLPSRIPGPAAPPLLGWRGGLLQALNDPIARLHMIYPRYGNVCGIVEDNAAWVFLFGPEHNHTVLVRSEQFQQPSFLLFDAAADSPSRRLDSGLITMNGAYHKHHRRLMMPALHKKYVEGYHQIMVEQTNATLNSWRSGSVLNIHQQMTELTLQIVSQTLFGIPGADDISGAIKQWLDSLFNPRVLFFPVALPGTPYARLLTLSARLEANIREMIAQKRANQGAQTDVLAMLIRARDEDGQGMSDDELIGHASVLFNAGHETSANALTWTLFLLEQHPAILAEVMDELDTVLGGAPPSVDQLPRLVVLEHTIKESLRLLSPISLYHRVCTSPAEFEGYAIPAGARVSISQYTTHRMPDLYPDPQRFQPRRWETISPSPYEYFPFGAGTHTCIGLSFAMQELKIVLAMLLQRYRLALVPHRLINRHLQITLAPQDGLWMQVHAQDRQFRHTLIDGNLHEMVNLPLH